MMPRALPRLIRTQAGDFFAIAVIGLMALKLSYGISGLRDVELSDECHYLSEGYNLLQRGLPPAQLGPLYAIWYFLLSRLQPDRMQLYFLNWSLLAVLLPISCYLLLRRLGGTRVAGLAAAFVLLTSGLVEVWPYPTHLATSVLVIGTALAVGLGTPPRAIAMLGVTLVLAAYIRPEYALSFGLFGLLALPAALWFALSRPEIRPAVLASAVLVGLTAGGMLLVLGNPLGGSRSFIAFEQHYARNVVPAEKLHLNWTTDYPAIVQRDFGDARTFPQALARNPRAVLWHVARNAAATPKTVVSILVPRLDLSRMSQFLLGPLAVAFASVCAVGLYLRVRRGGLVGEENRGLRRALVMFGLLLVPTGLAVLLVYPRQHYLIPIAVFAVALIGSSSGWLPGAGRLRTDLDAWPAVLCAAALLLSLTPVRAIGGGVRALFPWNRPRAATVLVYRATIETLESLQLRGPVVILERGYSRAFYAGMDFRYKPAWEKQEGFRQFLDNNKINLIVLDQDLAKDSRYRNDPEFLEFASQAQPAGFVVLPVPGTEVRVAVRQDLLAPAAETGTVSSGGYHTE